MSWMLVVLGCLWIAAGVILLIAPNFVKDLQLKILSSKYLRPIGIIPLVFGIILYMAAKYAAIVIFVKILGILGIIKGMALFLLPKKQIDLFMNWWASSSDLVARIWGAFALILGIAVILVKLQE